MISWFKAPLLFCFLFLQQLNLYAQSKQINNQFLKSVVDHSPILLDENVNRIQIVVGNVVKSKNVTPTIQYADYRLSPSEYFYPASCVKLPLVILAIEWMNEHRDSGINVTTEFELIANETCHSFKSNSSNKQDVLTIENCIKKILLVSDNRSYNALFDLLGRDYINAKLKQKGFVETRIVKSFSGCNDSSLNYKPTVVFYDNQKDIIFKQDSINYVGSISRLPMNAEIGDSIMLDSVTVIAGAKDFSMNNFLPLKDGLAMLIALVFPPKEIVWNITSTQQQFLLYWMSRYPRESKLTQYEDHKQYFDAYKKYLYYGREKTPIKKETFRIYNVVGLSYGFATDIAFIQSKDKKKQFFVAATSYSNSDGVMNDNKYDYDTIGFPFLKYLGAKLCKENKIVR